MERKRQGEKERKTREKGEWEEEAEMSESIGKTTEEWCIRPKFYHSALLPF